ncbi:hypothetical protein OAK13_05700 [Candidatus Thioglobus sp.]|nr:hypothetical protein [Candidatus Thioglobus sp.]
MLKRILLLSLFLIFSPVNADEVRKMSIIDGKTNQIKIEGFNFERLDSEDKTIISIKTLKETNVSCSVFDKNNRPVTSVEGKISPPLSELEALSKNVMVTSVKCQEKISKDVNQESKVMQMYFQMPTFLLDKI